MRAGYIKLIDEYIYLMSLVDPGAVFTATALIRQNDAYWIMFAAKSIALKYNVV